MNVKFLSAVALLPLIGLSSCATNSGTGALGGAAGGALIGQALGHSTGATLLGAGLGAAAGAIVGNEVDKTNAAREGRPVVYEQAPPPVVVSRPVVVMPGPECQHRMVWVDGAYGRQRERLLMCPNRYGEWEPVQR